MTYVTFFFPCALETNQSREKIAITFKWKTGSIDHSRIDICRVERFSIGKLTATRVLRASIRIVAGQASGEAVGCKLLDRSRVSIPDYSPTISRSHLVRKVSGSWSDSPGSTSISRDPLCRSGDMAPAPICRQNIPITHTRRISTNHTIV